MGEGKPLFYPEITVSLRLVRKIDFTWEPDTWYTMKLKVVTDEDKAIVSGKVWKRGTPEPKEWTLTVEDTQPERSGTPALIAYSPVEVYYDNLKVWENK